MRQKYIVRKGGMEEGGPVWGLWFANGYIFLGGPGKWLGDMLVCLEEGKRKWRMQWEAKRSRGRVLFMATARGQEPTAFAAFVEWLGRVDGGARTLQQVRNFRRLVH